MYNITPTSRFNTSMCISKIAKACYPEKKLREYILCERFHLHKHIHVYER